MSDGRRVRAFVAAATFLIAFAVYCATHAPTVFLIDSGPLTVAAWSLGNAHPPGFPLFLMVTHLTALLPFGSVAGRMNLASAFFAALACVTVALAVGEVWLRPDRRPAAAMLFGGLLLAFSRTLWGYATITEVYALNTFLIGATLWLVLRWRRTGDARLLYVAGVVFGLALGVHHVTAGLTLAGILILVIRGAGRRALGITAVCTVLTALAVYAYLPIAASRDPILNWGDPDNARDVIRHVTAKQYRGYVRTDAQAEQSGDFVKMIARELGPLALLVAVGGFCVLFLRDRVLFWALAAIIAAAFAWLAVYPIVDDEDAYLLPAFVALAIAAAYGGTAIAQRQPVWAAALLVIPLLAAIAHWPIRDRSRFFVASDYASNTLRGIAPNSILVTGDRHLWGALLYTTKVEKIRPDVTVVMYPLLIRSWYIEQLEQQHPAVTAEVATELAAYKGLLSVYENDERRWKADALVRDEFQRRLDDLVLALIGRQVGRGGRAYATPDVAMSREEIDSNLVERLKGAYDLVPGGLALEIMAGRRVRRITPVPLELRGLTSATDLVVTRDIVPAYVTALRLRARYLAATGARDAAAESERAASMLESAR